jgi:hypothetical protein
MFLRAQLKDGTQVVSEFSKLARVQRYIVSVFTGTKPFNAWKVTGEAHPVSGEEVRYRERRMYNGDAILFVEQVEPTTEDHGYDPSNFQPVATMQKGGRGTYTVPEGDLRPEELSEVESGTQFPLHRDANSFRDYIILQAADPEADEADEAGSERRFYTDGRGENPPAPSYVPASEEDWDEDEDDWDDDDDITY